MRQGHGGIAARSIAENVAARSAGFQEKSAILQGGFEG
jgi:hypothetical protein